MLRDIVGAMLFTISVLAFVNFVGDVAVQPRTPAEPAEEAAAAPEPEPAPLPEPTPEAAPEAAPATTPVEAAPEIAPQETAQNMAAATPAGDAAKGKKLFRKKCMTCHTMDKGGANRTGPNLWGIVDRPKATAKDFRYSKTLKTFGGVWTVEEIGSFIAGPRTFAPDTKMAFAGLKKQSERADVVAYLKTLTD